MEKEVTEKKNNTSTIILVVVLLGILLASYVFFKTPTIKAPASVKQIVVSPSAIQSARDYFSYRGVTGKTALTLLKQNAHIELDKSGMVSSINSRKADLTKHEFWAFYVNNKLAQVGSADYMAKDGDKIEWKVEKY